MRKMVLMTCCAVILFILGYLYMTGGQESDVVLEGYEVLEDYAQITIKVGVASSMGYVRGFKTKAECDALYVTFYSAFGLNNSLGAKEQFTIALQPEYKKIYFNRSEAGYELVLQKNETSNEWERVALGTYDSLVSP